MSIYKDDYELYKPFPSKSKNKKYSVYVMKNGKVKLLHFGDRRYQQYNDTLGYFSKLDHNDKIRRNRYYARMGETKDITTAKYWANNFLWSKKD